MPKTVHCDQKAGISVFFALSITLILSLFLLLCESARIQHARWYFTQTLNSGMDSLFSQYHRRLWEDYRLLGLEFYSFKQLEDELLAFEKPYIDAADFFPAKAESAEVLDLTLLTDDNGGIFEQQLSDYMKYGIVVSLADELNIQDFLGMVKEGNSISQISSLYEGHTKEAVSLEEKLEAIDQILKQQRRYYEDAGQSLEDCDCSGFVDNTQCMIGELERLPTAIQKYEKAADVLYEKLKESRAMADEEFQSGSISESTYASLNEEILEYESYAAVDGERRTEIQGLISEASSARSCLEMMIDEAEDIHEYIMNWEPEDEEDELDEDSLWEPLRERFRDFRPLSLGFSKGVEDKESERKLESIQQFLKGELLNLVIPKDASLSSEALKLEDAPSLVCHDGTDSSTLSIAGRLYLAEYVLHHMHYFGRDTYQDKEAKGSGGAEAEYILYGKTNDRENLSQAVNELLAIRTGLNLVYLYKDRGKYQEAKALAAAITGITGFAPLVSLVCFFILSLWAFAQAVCDVRDLLKGNKVPLLHDHGSFYLSLSGLMALTGGALPEQEDRGKGMSYPDYLRILLFAKQDSLMDYRCMDIIQLNLRRTQKDFRMDSCLHALEAGSAFRSYYLFSSVGLFRNASLTSGSYLWKSSACYSY